MNGRTSIITVHVGYLTINVLVSEMPLFLGSKGTAVMYMAIHRYKLFKHIAPNRFQVVTRKVQTLKQNVGNVAFIPKNGGFVRIIYMAGVCRFMHKET